MRSPSASARIRTLGGVNRAPLFAAGSTGYDPHDADRDDSPNRATVIRITGRGVPNPDLIYPGQVLLIPALPGVRVDPVVAARVPASPPVVNPPKASNSPPSEARSPQPMRQPGQPPNGGRSLSDELKEVSSPISIKYRLDDVRLPPIIQPGYTLEVRMTGDVLLMSQRTYPALYVTQRQEIEAQVVTQANHAFGALVNDSRPRLRQQTAYAHVSFDAGQPKQRPE